MGEDMTKCPKCERTWEPVPYSEQRACIELFGECISCRRFVLTNDEIKQIQDNAMDETAKDNNDS